MNDIQDNIYEELQEWIEADETAALDIIFKHELDTTKPEDLGKWFRSELKRREVSDV